MFAKKSLILASAIMLGLAVGVPAPRAAGPATLVSADDSRVIFEVDLGGYRIEPSTGLDGAVRLDIPGFGAFATVGEPLVPGRDYLVALPPRGAFSVTYSVLATEALGVLRLEPVPFPVVIRGDDGLVTPTEEYRIDPAIYNGGGRVIGVSAQPESRLRHQRVVPIRVEPVSYDPATGETVIATRIRVEVSISAGTGANGAPIQETDVWERVYHRLLVNPEQGASWRAKPTRVPRAQGPQSSVYQATAGPLVKLGVTETGFHRVSAATVIAKGFPAGTATSQLRVFKRAYDPVTMSEVVIDVPSKVIEGGGIAGEFDGTDYLVFFGQDVREDTLRHDPFEKFSEQNIYWLGDSGGARIAQKVVTPGTVTPDTATAAFPVTLRKEADLFFQEEVPPANSLDGGPMREFYYYHGSFLKTFSVGFTIGAIKPATTFQITAQIVGADAFHQNAVRIELINTQGTTLLQDVLIPYKDVVRYTSAPLSSDVLVEGLNTLRIQPTARTVQNPDLEVVLDWFTVDYVAPYRAVGNRLTFDTAALSGTQNITVTGFTRNDVMLFDVTDPLAPEECQLDTTHFADLGGGQSALSFVTNIVTQQDYVVTPLDGIPEIAASDVIEDEPSNLIGNPAESGVDILVVAHGDYISEMQRWVDYRRAQGYRVLMAVVDDVYDEFNGGVHNARAIRAMTRHFFETGGASFLVLVGDASEDNKNVHIDSPPNFVPTESFSEHVASPVFNEDEVVTTDKWYVMLNTDVIYDNPQTGPEFFPSLIVGRFPAGTVDELRIVLDKTFAFEQPAADDFWRRRVIRVADDAYSGTGNVCFQPPEVDFEASEERAAVITENSIPNGYDVVRFYLSNRVAHPSNCMSLFGQRQETRATATPVLLSELAEGASIVSFQAHMNRYLICHEALFTASSSLGFGQRDYLALNNVGKPFVLFGMGCHLSDFALHREMAQARQVESGLTGDCLSEQILHQPNRGAVDTYGSSGFEYLRENKNFTEILAEVIYDDPPTGPMIASGRSQARWIMGELMTVAEIENLNRYPVGSGLGARGQAKRYHTLGDPLLRIDAGPPRFEVTVDGQPFNSGDLLFAGTGSDSVQVRAVITDEVAIEKLTLEIDGADATSQMTVTPLVDVGLDASRQYEVLFSTRVLPRKYDIILRAHQAADTTSDTYHMVAEFVLKVELTVSLSINGRPTLDGDLVPAKGDYVVELNAPVVIDTSLIHVDIDGSRVSPIDFSHPTPQDSTTWLIGFTATLTTGQHTVSVFVDNGSFDFNLVVGSAAGVRDLIAYPNPFAEETFFVYSNDLEIADGTIDIFTTSGRKIAHLAIPPSARAVGQNSVRWDGTTYDGGQVANGVYLFVLKVSQGGQTQTQRGKLVKVR